MWDLIDYFQAFNLTFIHRENNHKVDSLAVIASMFIPSDYEMENSFKVSTLYRPIVPDNEKPLQVFGSDEHAQFFFIGTKEKEQD